MLKFIKLSSLAAYGSVARGVAKKESDVDLLIVSNDFTRSLGSRIDRLVKVEEALREELAWFRKHGFYTSFSFYPLREEEAEKAPMLFLDLVDEAIILYDRGRLLERILSELKAKLLKMGARRVLIDKDRWYWDLNPNYKFGDVVSI